MYFTNYKNLIFSKNLLYAIRETFLIHSSKNRNRSTVTGPLL